MGYGHSGQVSVEEVHVGAAHLARHHLEDGAPRLGPRGFERPPLERASGSGHHHRLDGLHRGGNDITPSGSIGRSSPRGDSCSCSNIASSCCLLALTAAAPAAARGLQSADFLKMRAAGDVAVAPDGARIAYTVERNDRPGRPVEQVFVMALAGGEAQRIGTDEDNGSDPRWSPDGQLARLQGPVAGKEGLHVVQPDGGGAALPGPGPGHQQPPHLRGDAPSPGHPTRSRSPSCPPPPDPRRRPRPATPW